MRFKIIFMQKGTLTHKVRVISYSWNLAEGNWIFPELDNPWISFQSSKEEKLMTLDKFILIQIQISNFNLRGIRFIWHVDFWKDGTRFSVCKSLSSFGSLEDCNFWTDRELLIPFFYVEHVYKLSNDTLFTCTCIKIWWTEKLQNVTDTTCGTSPLN